MNLILECHPFTFYNFEKIANQIRVGICYMMRFCIFRCSLWSVFS